jgi:selenocysteine-specific elongation factor
VRLGFVDVPGHERFVKNMLAGAHGIDMVALVIAADEGVMPQTREHFDICRLLGVKAGLVVITKSDMVDSELLELVKEEASELVSGSFLEQCPFLTVSAKIGEGIEGLKESLRAIAVGIPPRSSDALPRLPVDRAFTMRGFGTVVTGTLVAGNLTVGDEVELLPSQEPVRVRGLQVHGRQVEVAQAGQRTAVNLGGIDVAQVDRGMVLAPSKVFRPTQIIDVRVDVLDSAPRPLGSRSRVRVHIGAAEILARVHVLETSGRIEPGSSGFAQLRMESPVVALADEHFILRSYSPSRTIAGGLVLDPLACRHRGRDFSKHHKSLTALSGDSRAERVSVYVQFAGEWGLTPSDLAARTGLQAGALANALDEAVKSGKVVEAESVLIAVEWLDRLVNAVVSELTAFHQREPLARGILRETLRERVFTHSRPEIFRLALSILETKGKIVADKDIVRLADHSLELAGADKQLYNGLEQVYRNAGNEAPSLDEALEHLGAAKTNREQARKILQLLINDGSLVRINNEMIFHSATLDSLTAKLRSFAESHSPDRMIDMLAFKDLAGVSRKYAIPLLEYFDRQRVTRRAGDKRQIL